VPIDTKSDEDTVKSEGMYFDRNILEEYKEYVKSNADETNNDYKIIFNHLHRKLAESISEQAKREQFEAYLNTVF
jgi:hypothetical protein